MLRGAGSNGEGHTAGSTSHTAGAASVVEALHKGGYLAVPSLDDPTGDDGVHDLTYATGAHDILFRRRSGIQVQRTYAALKRPATRSGKMAAYEVLWQELCGRGLRPATRAVEPSTEIPIEKRPPPNEATAMFEDYPVQEIGDAVRQLSNAPWNVSWACGGQGSY